jgi:hypothetical protein
MPRFKKLCVTFLALVPICFGQDAWVTQNWIPSDAAHLPSSEVQSLLSLICPNQAAASGCEACPQDTTGGAEKWELRAIYLGHFLSPSSQDALVSGFGCEPHSDGVGGSYLLTGSGSSWTKIRYVAGLIAWDCKKLAGADGRDRLVCGLVDGNQGHMSSSLSLADPGVDLTKTDTLERQFERGYELDNRGVGFFGVEDTTGAMEPRVQREFIERVEFEKAAGEQVRIDVSARAGWADVPSGVVEKAAAAQGPPVIVATVPQQYDFVFDGTEIHPAPNNPKDAPQTSYSLGK